MIFDWSTPEATNYIAFAALLFSILFGVFNYGYTRRNLKILSDPVVFPTIDSTLTMYFNIDELNYIVRDTLLFLHLKNQSNAVSLSEVEAELSLIDKTKTRFNRTKIEYVSIDRSALEPLQEAGSGKTAPNFEEFLMQKFETKYIVKSGPMVQGQLHGQSTSGAGKHGEGEIFYYIVPNPRMNLILNLKVSYTPAINGAKRKHETHKYQLKPTLQKRHGLAPVLIGWEIQKQTNLFQHGGAAVKKFPSEWWIRQSRKNYLPVTE